MYKQDEYKEESLQYDSMEQGKVNRSKKKTGSIRRGIALLVASVIFGSGSAVSFHVVDDMLGEQESVSEVASLSRSEGMLQQLSVDGDFTAQKAILADNSATVENAETESTDSFTAIGQSLDVSKIAENSLPSIVSITNISVQEVEDYFSMFRGYGRGKVQMEETTSCGSGILIGQSDEYLYMVTNNHVVEDATTLSVTFVNEETYEAKLCGADEDRDLAVVAVALEDVSADTLSQISIVEIGDSQVLKVGEQVVAIGNALGYGQSVTTGIVSALDRSLSSDSGDVVNTYIQTDAAINPGNSGGALLNMKGQLVGINTAKLASTEVEGMGYAIPISDVWEIITQLAQQEAEANQTETIMMEGQQPEGYANGQMPFGGQMYYFHSIPDMSGQRVY